MQQPSDSSNMAQLQQELAVDRPLKLGSTMTHGPTTDGFFMLSFDFQPESMKRAAQADLLLFGEQQEQVGAHPSLTAWHC